MIGLVLLIKTHVGKIFFCLGLAVKGVGGHQIPVDGFLHHVLPFAAGQVKGVLGLAQVFYRAGGYAAFFLDLPQGGGLVGFALLQVAFGEYPAHVPAVLVLIQKQHPVAVYDHTAAADGACLCFQV